MPYLVYLKLEVEVSVNNRFRLTSISNMKYQKSQSWSKIFLAESETSLSCSKELVIDLYLEIKSNLLRQSIYLRFVPLPGQLEQSTC
jgi:hypothetical protein